MSVSSLGVEQDRANPTPTSYARLFEGTRDKVVQHPGGDCIVTYEIAPEAMSVSKDGKEYGKWKGLILRTKDPYDNDSKRLQYTPTEGFQRGRNPVGLEAEEHRLFDLLRNVHGFESAYPFYVEEIPKSAPKPDYGSSSNDQSTSGKASTPQPSRPDWSHVFEATEKKPVGKAIGDPLVIRVRRDVKDGADATPFEMAKFAEALHLRKDVSGKFDRVLSIFGKPVGVDFHAYKSDCPRYWMIAHVNVNVNDSEKSLLRQALHNRAQSIGLAVKTMDMAAAHAWYSFPNKKLKGLELDRVLAEMPPIGRKPINAATYNWKYTSSGAHEELNIAALKPSKGLRSSQVLISGRTRLAAMEAVLDAHSRTLANIRGGDSICGHEQPYIDAIDANLRHSAYTLAHTHEADGESERFAPEEYHDAMKLLLPEVLSEACYELGGGINSCIKDLAKALPLNKDQEEWSLSSALRRIFGLTRVGF